MMIREVWQRVNALVRPHRLDQDHIEEVDFHLAMLTQRLESEGLSPDAARRRARLTFGARSDIREEAREARGTVWLDDAIRDLRHAVRQLRSTPIFTLTMVATLGLAIGATTAVLTAADQVLLRPVPFRDADQLLVAWETDTRSGTVREPASYPDYLDLARSTRTLASLDALVGAIVTLHSKDGEPTRLSGVAVTHGLLPTLGIQPIRGRTFTPVEASSGGSRVALISEALWRSHFAASDAVLGSLITLDDTPTEIIGVMPAHSDYGLDQLHERAAYHGDYESAGSVDLWLPLQTTVEAMPRETHPLLLVGRLAPGASVASAQRELAQQMAELEATYPSNVARGIFLESLPDVVVGPIRPLLGLLLAAAILLSLVATVNVANLLLVRGTARAREVALRGALGASATRLARQFAVEAALLVSLGTFAGLFLAAAALRLVRQMAPASIPRLDEAGLDVRGVAAAVILAGVVGAVFSLLPALSAFRHDPMAVLKDESGAMTMPRRGRRTRNTLVMMQLAVCVTLAVVTGLVLRSFRAVLNVDAGFSAQQVVKAQYELPTSRYPRNFANFPRFTAITQFSDRLLATVQSLPGVQAAAIAAAHPLDKGFTNSWRVIGREAEGRDWPEISVRIVSAGYLETMGVAQQRGRGILASDNADTPPMALINEATARRFFAAQEPIGQKLSFWGIERLIVGVVSNERFQGLTTDAPAAVYIPLHQAPGSSGVLLVRSDRPAHVMVPELRRALTTVDPLLAPYGMEAFEATVRDSVSQRRLAVWIMGAFALVTCLLVIVGVHGVISWMAVQRTREIGIRQALGASPWASVRLISGGTGRLILAGTMLGVVGALGATPLVSSQLFGVGRLDPATFVLVPCGVALVALGAALAPAWRAVRRAPLQAIREG